VLASPSTDKIADISRKFNVPRTTLRREHDKIRKNLGWTPLDTLWGEHRRIFSNEIESMMAEEIRANYVQPHRLFTTEDFCTLALRWYRDVYRDVGRETRFVCSPEFIRGFRGRNRFSLRRNHFKRRTPVSEEEQAKWIADVTTLLATEDNDLILNCDETAWRLYPEGILTWWDTGADNVSISIQGDEKDSMTVLATISASHQKWPLFCVAKGKTERVERSQIGDVGGHWRSHSQSGWMTGEIFADYLRHLRQHAPTEG
jgi:hypothetical protein